MRSPVPYRVGPLEHSPAVLCDCRRKAPCWTSWSNDSPGRRYYRCPAGLTAGDCGFFRWIDHEATPYERQLTRDLRDAVWQLQREKGEDLRMDNVVQRENGDLMQLKEQLQKDEA
ncbi:hypothetical protein HU200_040857 [Digitaria exilis]|uniref:GRF-type domain-containing protein n=1 Tax=Digitaria exilis TaxID=1010633 RepID=A0A835EI58_9POAL|nr:hypothetical protein HU200_040857 [Digitaria exilis]